MNRWDVFWHIVAFIYILNLLDLSLCLQLQITWNLLKCIQVCMKLKHFIMNEWICLINDLIRISGFVVRTMLIMVGHQAAEMLPVNQRVWRRLPQGGQRKSTNVQSTNSDRSVLKWLGIILNWRCWDKFDEIVARRTPGLAADCQASKTENFNFIKEDSPSLQWFQMCREVLPIKY